MAASNVLNDFGLECTILSIKGSASRATPSTTSITNRATRQHEKQSYPTFDLRTRLVHSRRVLEDFQRGLRRNRSAHTVSHDDETYVVIFVRDVFDHFDAILNESVNRMVRFVVDLAQS